MDLSMPDMTSLTAIRLISAEMPEIKVIVLTASEDDEGVLEAVKFGASGYFNKNIESDEFFDLLVVQLAAEVLTPRGHDAGRSLLCAADRLPAVDP